MAVCFFVLAALAGGCRDGSRAATAKAAGEASAVADGFPLRVGNAWTYEGSVSTQTQGTNEASGRVRVTMRVVEEKHSDCAALYLMEGHPVDAAWFEPRGKPGEVVEVPASRYGYLVVANKVFRIDGARADKVKQAMAADGFLPNGLVGPDDLEFEFPLAPGKRFGNPDGITRPDFSYCWLVVDAADKRFAPALPQGKQPPSTARCRLVFETRPDHQIVGFDPTVGITDFAYEHHGTVATVQLHLTGANVTR
jgi:hypothetical protein